MNSDSQEPINRPAPEFFAAQLASMPKVELHCHLLGTVQKETFWEWAQREKTVEKAILSRPDIDAFFAKSDKPVGAIRVLRALDQFLIRKPDDLYRLSYEYLQSAASHEVMYSEFFWNPTGTAQLSGIAYPEALAAIVHAMQDAKKDFGIESGLIPSIDREASAEAALEMLEWVLKHRHDKVLGIGMDYRETEHPPEKFVAVYTKAKRMGLKSTAHAGEFGCPSANVATAVKLLEVDRLDHAYTAIDDPGLCEQIARRDIIITVVPSNSYYKRTLAPERWALDHPIRRMPNAGLKIHPNTDDPTLHHVTPTQAWQMMMEDFGFGWADLQAFALNGICAAWADDSQKQVWRQQTLEFFEPFESKKIVQ